VEDLSNYELLDSLITKEENKIWDKNLLDFSYWEKLIIDELNKIKI
jgi:hypothetical protein